jgi:hypothetical protein
MKITHKRGQLVRTFAVGLLLTCTFTLQAINAASIQEQSRVDRWLEDIDQLTQELPARHKDLYFRLSEEEFMSKIETLKKKVPEQNDEEIIFSLSVLIASIGDAHTSLNVMPKTAFPFTLYWFKEGIYVVNTLPEYEKILYSRLKEIDHKAIDDIVEILSGAISHENAAQIKQAIPFSLIQSERLFGAAIIDDRESAVFTFQKEDAEPFLINIEAMSMKEQFRPIVDTSQESDLPLYRRNRSQYYSYFHLQEEKTLYVLYNSCRTRKDMPFPEYVRDIFKIVDENDIERFVVDLRNNGGGNSSIFHPLIDELKQRENLNKDNRLFVILGRNTFSSAVLNAVELKNETQATFIGEPTGGKPNHFGEVKWFLLKNSGLNVSYSTKYFTFSELDTDSLYPDIFVEISIRDYLNKKDPILERIREISRWPH